VKGERGQVVVLTVVMIAALLGLGAMVLDVGAWFRTKRQVQATADAAALAGAQELHLDAGQAQALAVQYGTSNGGGVASADVTFESQWTPGDTIVVHAHKSNTSYFSKIFGVGDQEIGARAKARSEAPGEAKYVAPIGVDRSHPLLSGSGCPCFHQSTTLDLEKVGPGAFRLLNIDGSRGGTNNKTLADWMSHGYGDYMGLGWFWSDSGSKFNGSDMKDALATVRGHDLLFPVYDQTQAQGTNFQYRVVGWVAFRLTGYAGNGNHGTLDGYFTSITWDGVQAQPPSEDFGAHTIQLVE
jgi:Putative Flp pilus-assembly TadE/G-like